MLKLITAPTYVPVSVARAKERLHIDTSDFDDDLEVLLETATDSLDQKANIVTRVSSWEYRPDRYREQGRRWPLSPYQMHWDLDHGLTIPFPHLEIPQAPIRDVTSVKYLDPQNVVQTVDPSQYSWVRTREGASVTFVPGFTIPEISILPQSVRIAFDAGFDDPNASGGSDDPELKFPRRAEMAILFLVAHWHTNRSPVVSDTRAAPFEIPQTFDDLAQQLKVYR